jgi:tryptophan synthase beta chain
MSQINHSSSSNAKALAAFRLLARLEVIIPALESAHAIAEVMKFAPSMTREQVILVNLSGRGDKDVNTVAAIVTDSHAAL